MLLEIAQLPFEEAEPVFILTDEVWFNFFYNPKGTELSNFYFCPI